MNAKELRAAFVAKLKSSGLTLADAKRLEFRPLTAEQVAAQQIVKRPAAGFVIPYFTFTGRRLTDFYRFRYLEQPAPGGFGGAVGAIGKELRYMQPAHTTARVYWSLLVKWTAIFALPAEKRRLVITEGELKANKACRMEIPTIGLGGVWNFRSGKKGELLLAELDELDWRDTGVYIVYDSDAAAKSDVLLAEAALAAQLVARRAHVFIGRMPSLFADRKTGLDDYLVERGAERFVDEVLTPAAEWAKSRELFEIDREWMVCESSGYLIDRHDGLRLSHNKFVQVSLADRQLVRKDAEGKPKVTSAAVEYLKWSGRTAVWKETYRPGAPQLVPSSKPKMSDYNRWTGWGCKPEEGDVRPFLDLFNFLFKAEDDGLRRTVMQWLAYPLQHPGAKLKWALLLWGRYKGTGKSFLGYIMKEIYGRNFAEIESKHLDRDFTEWAEGKQFVMGDEIHRAATIKNNITREQVLINLKNIPAFYLPDRINYYFTSNEPDALHFDDNERRYAVVEVLGPPASDAFYRRIDEWRQAGGARAVFDYLLRYPLSGFNPNAAAPVTRAKLEMAELGVRDDLELWAQRLREEPDSVLRVGDRVVGGVGENGKQVPRTLWRLEELLAIADPGGAKRWSAKAFAVALSRVGFRKAYCSAHSKKCVVAVPGVGPLNLWLVRKHAGLPTSNHKTVVEAYQEERRTELAAAKKF